LGILTIYSSKKWLLVMSFCTACLYPQNPDQARFCIQCGKSLLLKDRYRPLYPIGSGGFGRTFLAVDQHLPSKHRCVIKQLYFPDANKATFNKAVELFHQEAVRLDELQHPQIPKLLAHFEQDNQLYLIQELIVGQTLAQELQAQGVFREAHIWQLLKDLLPILQFIHSRQVIHRDIKPANIMRRANLLVENEFKYPSPVSNTALSNKGSTITIGGMESISSQQKRRNILPFSKIKPANQYLDNSVPGDLVLIDFGVAKQITATALVNTGTTVGSAEYMAPEQMRGKALPASDLYSLGVSCIYLLTGISPFELFDVTSDRWIWQNYLPNGNSISDRLSIILDKLLQNALSQRYQSATEVLAAINVEVKPVKQQPVNTLNSAAGVDYKRLRDLLMTKQWQQADEETWVVMCQSLSKPVNSYLFKSDLENLPDQDLQIIDQLWTKYSQSHFGFTVQIQIYENCGRDYSQFCGAVGWNLIASNSPTHNLFFMSSAPKGRLPSHNWVGGTQSWKHMNTLATKLLGNG
jgi:serine/threonine protein kinase